MDGSIVVGKVYRLACSSIHCRPQCLSTAYAPDILFRQECAEVPGLKAIVTNNGYRRIACRIYCGRQWLSMNTFLDLLWSAMAVDRCIS